MTETYDHYITKHIRHIYCQRLISPILYLLLLAALWLVFPLYEILFPQPMENPGSLEKYGSSHASYVELRLTDLYFTGYANTVFGQTNGYFYYTFWEDQCVIVLLAPDTCEEGIPHIESVDIRGRVLKGNGAYDALLDSLAQDLNWTTEGILEKVNGYFISEPAFGLSANRLLAAVYIVTGAYALVRLLCYLLYACVPACCPPCRKLRLFGKPSALLSQAETELATLPQLTTEDMFITEHFFIALSRYGVALVPIEEMIWIYKYSTLKKIFWYHFNISYTLHINASRHFYIQCPKNEKSDIDGIIDYLSEANHDILVGFSEENRLKVRSMQHYRLSLHLAKIIVKFQKLRRK